MTSNNILLFGGAFIGTFGLASLMMPKKRIMSKNQIKRNCTSLLGINPDKDEADYVHSEFFLMLQNEKNTMRAVSDKIRDERKISKSAKEASTAFVEDFDTFLALYDLSSYEEKKEISLAIVKLIKSNLE